MRRMWQPDVKWILSLLAIVALGVSLLLATLFTLTRRETVVEATTLSYAVFLSGEKGLDSADDVEALQTQLTTAPNQTIQPISGFSISISLAEITGLTPREARLHVIRKFTEPIYDGGAEGLAQLATDEALKAKILTSRMTLDLLSHKTHDRVRFWVQISLALTALLTLLAMLFSYRFGRLATAGWILLVGTLPGCLFWWLISMRPPGLAATGTAQITNVGTIFSFVASQVLPDRAQELFNWQRLIVISGAGLILLAIVGGLLFREKTKTDKPIAHP